MSTTMKGTIGGGLTFTASPAIVSVPSGFLVHTTSYFNATETFNITIPNNVHVVEVYAVGDSHYYPEVFMRIYSKTKEWGHSDTGDYVEISEYIGVTPNKQYSVTVDVDPPGAEVSEFYIKYSPEINNKTPAVTDY